MSFGTVAIVGVGLIGGSVGLALRAKRLAQKIIGVGYRQETLDVALGRGAVDETTTDLAAGVADADLVLLGTPVDLTVTLGRKVQETVAPQTVVTDVGSTKEAIVRALDAARFVGAHPLAGGEQRGIAAARADLFEGATCVLTPTERTVPAAVDRVARLWEALGATVIAMAADEHDQGVAAVSHLPHLAAAALVQAVPEKHRELASSGFWSTTRVASGDPTLWRPIFRQNREALLEVLEALECQLGRFREALQRDDGAAIGRLLDNAKRIRDAMAG